MNTRRAMLLTLLAICLATATVPVRADEAANRPNILFFLSDDQRADMLGSAGHPVLKTPTLDALAEAGVRFENALVTTSICAASRATILSGMYERTHRYTFGTPPLADEFLALSYPALLKRAGYITGFVGKFGVNLPADRDQSLFDFYVPLDRTPYFKPLTDGKTRHVDEIAGDRALEFLKAMRPGNPFCLQVSFNSPHAEDADLVNHYPWPPSASGMYENVTIPGPVLKDPKIFEGLPNFLKQSLNRERYFWSLDEPDKYQKNVRAYYRMISGLDNIINRVLIELNTLGLGENTIVIFSADNGYYQGERGLSGKWSHFDESLRVPLIVFDPRAPQSQRGKVAKPLTVNADIPATILSYAGAAIPAAYQGTSLRPLLRGEKPEDWRADTFVEHLFDHPKIPEWEGVRGERFVYARYLEQTPAFEFLHDLEVDPQQLQNFVENARYVKVLEVYRDRCDELRSHYEGQRQFLLGTQPR